MIRRIVRDGIRMLIANRVAEPHNSLKIICEECFKGKENTHRSFQLRKFQHLLRLRRNHYPLQYLCRVWPFRALDLRMKAPVLIPRYETEYLVQLIVAKVKQIYIPQQITKIKFIEFGCGSGAIGLSLHKQLALTGAMIDIEPACIQLSQYNAVLNNCSMESLTFIEEDMGNRVEEINKFDIVVSNPPYLSQTHYQKYLMKQVKGYEAKNALVADEDGMKYIRMIARKWKQRGTGKKGILALQFDGRYFSGADAWLQEYVEFDQYEKRRFIFIQSQ